MVEDKDKGGRKKADELDLEEIEALIEAAKRESTGAFPKSPVKESSVPETGGQILERAAEFQLRQKPGIGVSPPGLPPRKPQHAADLESILSELALKRDEVKEAKVLPKEAIPVSFEAMVPGPMASTEIPLEQFSNVRMNVKVVLGRTKMYVEDILKLGPGSVIQLDKFAGEPLDILVNDRLVARGEILVLSDNFCIRITEFVTSEQRSGS